MCERQLVTKQVLLAINRGLGGQMTPTKLKSESLAIIKCSRYRIILMLASCCGESIATRTLKDLLN